MTAEKRNLPASISARLLAQAKESGDDYQTLLTSFCLERFLYRLGESGARDRFVLKGAMLLRLWSDRPYRATRDLDLLRQGDGSDDAIRADLRSICSTEVVPDGLWFDPESLSIEPVRANHEYAGVRVTLPAGCGPARLKLQLDLGVGDAVWPKPQACSYPSLLEFPFPSVLAYPPEAVIAEKLEALVVLGERNSRIKDFFDLCHLANRFEFDRTTLAEAIRRTFSRRRTPLPDTEPVGLTDTYWEDPSRDLQVQAFVKRAGLREGPKSGIKVLATLRTFLLPLLADLRNSREVSGIWSPGGPWST